MSALPDHPRISIITQARMTSSRLPGKVMCEVAGKSMLLHHIERLRKNGHSVIIATTMNPEDDVIDSFALTHSIPCYRGDEHDVLGRFYHANQMFPADIIVRVTSDCPLIDSELIQQGIEKYIELNDDRSYVSNCFPRTYARGFDFEIFSAAMLAEAQLKASSQHEREHVTPYMREHYANYMHNISQERENGALRLTLDTPEDLRVLTHIMEETQALQSGYKTIEDTLMQHPQWVAINSHIEQKKV